MILSLSLFLYLYYAFVAVWFVFSLVAVYHMVRFSQINFLSFLSVLIYAGGSLALVGYSSFLINQIDWERPLDFLGGFLKLSF